MRRLARPDQFSSGDWLMGDGGGHALIYSIRNSGAMPGLVVVETDVGPVYLDPDEYYEVEES